jgi:putative lipoic acid-binding regulatory protein
METPQPGESLLVFPCDFPIKVLGEAAADFDALVVSIVRRHVPDLREGAVTSKASRQGRYVSVTVTVQARSQAQLDALYVELSGHERVLMVL